jgi:AcrR family transcriptional regulator
MSARAASTEATGERVLAAAAEAFGSTAYDQVSLEKIATDANVTVRTVVRRFGSKEGLFAEVARRRAATIREARAAAVAGATEEAIRVVVDGYEKWGDSTLNFLAQETRSGPIGELVRSGRAFHHAWVERVFGPLIPTMSPPQRRRRLGALVAVTDVYTWKVLRRDLRLTRRDTEAILLELVEGAIGSGQVLRR